METFNTDTENFALLRVSLPPKLMIDSSSVVFIANGELCLLTHNKQMALWKIDSELEFRLSSIDRKVSSHQQPLIVGSLVFIARKEAVEKFSLKTYSFLA